MYYLIFRQNQESYYSAGGFDAGDNEFEEKREKFTDVRQKSNVKIFLILFFLIILERDKLFENVSMPDKCMECTKVCF